MYTKKLYEKMAVRIQDSDKHECYPEFYVIMKGMHYLQRKKYVMHGNQTLILSAK